jgi:hypothetical protein
MSDENGLVMINLVPVRKGVPPEEFARFSAEVDQPTWLEQEVVRSFDAFQVVRRVGDVGAVDIIEVLEVRSLEEWERISQTGEAVKPLAATFDSLADGAGVRTIYANRIRPA